MSESIEPFDEPAEPIEWPLLVRTRQLVAAVVVVPVWLEVPSPLRVRDEAVPDSSSPFSELRRGRKSSCEQRRKGSTVEETGQRHECAQSLENEPKVNLVPLDPSSVRDSTRN